MIDDHWHELLHSWSRHILATSDYRDYLPEEVIDKQNLWIGYSGASEEQIVQAERRLKTRLPASYREFLKVSNGWPTGGPYVARILPIEEIEWVSARKNGAVIHAKRQTLEGEIENNLVVKGNHTL